MTEGDAINTIKVSEFHPLTRPNTPQCRVERMDAETASDEKPRAKWGKGVEFLMSCISLSVGLGNIWRFPYVCYNNGGGAFVVAYLTILLFIGKPFYFLEMILGQFTSKGSMKAIAVVPILRGVGWGQQIASAVITTYYSSIIALALNYAYRSFAAELPWSTCQHFDEPCLAASTLERPANITNGTMTSTEYFLTKEILQQSEDLSNGLGSFVPAFAICFVISWICIQLNIVKGIKTSGKLSYVFAILPYFILFTILGFALTLEGSGNGVKYFLFPGGNTWGKLLDPNTWVAATTQCFFSLTIGMGCIIMFSSYNEFDRNIYKDAMIVSIMDTFTSMLGGVTIFAVLGNLAQNTGREMNQVINNKTSSAGLAFLIYPEAISKMSTTIGESGYWPQAMAIFFFMMLFTLGVGSAVGLLNNITTNLADYFPRLKSWQLSVIGVLGCFSVGLMYVTQGGFYIVDVVDHFGGQFLIFALALAELIGVVWIYGVENLCWDVEFMLKKKVSAFWRVSWFLIMPIYLLVVAVFFAYDSCMKKLEISTDKPFPDVVIFLGWLLFVIGLGQILISAFVHFMKKRKNNATVAETMTYLFSPCPKWGPKSSTIRAEWIKFKQANMKEKMKVDMEHGHSWFQQKCWILTGRYTTVFPEPNH